MPEQLKVAIEAKLAGERLDRILHKLLPGSGLRQCRRMIEEGLVSLNGRQTRSAARPAEGDQLEITHALQPCAAYLQPFAIACGASYSFFFKPRGLHSATIAGNDRPSLENSLPPGFKLLQRLDFNTCGIVCAAANESAERNFRAWETKGACRKWYLCLLEGKMAKAMVSNAPLDTANRSKTRILPGQSDKLRSTLFLPLPELATPENLPASWAIAGISRGQRHQIRAHAAGLGHPLLNDNLYGGGGNGDFYLWHFLMEFPGHNCLHLEETPGGFPLPAPAMRLRKMAQEKIATVRKCGQS